VVAGGVGSGARYLIGLWAIGRFGPEFPYGTLLINLAGCFALGVVTQLAAASAWNPEVRVAVAVGLLGGFTTYSTFNQETLQLLMSGSAGAAIVNVAITVIGGLAAGWLGLVVARQLVA
jgi:CrcB protein